MLNNDEPADAITVVVVVTVDLVPNRDEAVVDDENDGGFVAPKTDVDIVVVVAAPPKSEGAVVASDDAPPKIEVAPDDVAPYAPDDVVPNAPDDVVPNAPDDVVPNEPDGDVLAANREGAVDTFPNKEVAAVVEAVPNNGDAAAAVEGLEPNRVGDAAAVEMAIEEEADGTAPKSAEGVVVWPKREGEVVIWPAPKREGVEVVWPAPKGDAPAEGVDPKREEEGVVAELVELLNNEGAPVEIEPVEGPLPNK